MIWARKISPLEWCQSGMCIGERVCAFLLHNKLNYTVITKYYLECVPMCNHHFSLFFIMFDRTAILKWFTLTHRPKHHHQEFAFWIHVAVKLKLFVLVIVLHSALKFPKTVSHTGRSNLHRVLLTFIKSNFSFAAPYGIFARSCVAMAKDSKSTFQIIDDEGCPVDPTIFPGFSPEANALQSVYEAFRFTESYGVIFQCNVKYCLGPCEPAVCEWGRDSLESWGRKRRSIARWV